MKSNIFIEKAAVIASHLQNGWRALGLSFICMGLVIYSSAQQSQYPNTVIDFSSQYSAGCNPATAVLGAPNAVGCGDNCNAWTGSTPDGQREYLVLGFLTPQPATEIYIYENYNPDPVDTVYLRNSATQVWTQVFSQTAHAVTCPNVLKITIPTTPYNIDAIRIAVNSPAVAGYNEIDAVLIKDQVGPLSLGAVVANQNNKVIFPAAANVDMMSLDLPVSGAVGSLVLNSLTITSANTNDPDITGVKLWIGTSVTHVNQIGSTQIFSAGSATFSGLADSLFVDDNYLWITYDLASNIPGLPHIADAKINVGNITIAASGGANNPGTQPPSTLDPLGYLTIFSKTSFPFDNGQRLYFFSADTSPNGNISFIENYLTPHPGITYVCPVPSIVYNGLAANPLDGYLYYYDFDLGLVHLVPTGNLTQVCPNINSTETGTFDSQGRYWEWDQNNQLVAVDITTCQVVKGPFAMNSSGDYIDIAYNSRDGYIYTSGGRVDTNGVFDNSYSNPQFIPNQNYGGVGMGSDGNLYGIGDDGTLSVINLTSYTSKFVYDFFPILPFVGQSDMASFPPSSPPVSSFKASDTTFCSGNCTNFTNLSTNATSWQWSFPGALPSSSSAPNPQGICYYNAGTYSATLIAAKGGLSDTLTFNTYIKVFPAPLTPVITQRHDTLFCQTDPTYTSYQWYDSTSLLPGATDTFLIVTHGGNYNVAVANENGCKISVGINIAHNVGINEFYSNHYVSVFPNPATDKLLISGNWKSGSGKLKLTIFNVIGEIIYTEQINCASVAIDCKPFSNGIYFVQVTNEDVSWIGRFVKE